MSETEIINNYAKENPVRSIALVAVFNKSNQVLLVKTTLLPNWWQPIGGGINKNTPVEGLIEKVYQEVRLKLDPSKLKLITTLPYDFGEGEIFCYAYKSAIDEGSIMLSKDSIADSQWVDLEDAVNLKCFKATNSFLKILNTDYKSHINEE